MNTPTSHIELRRLQRLRWAVRAILATGLTASIAANTLHAEHDAASQAIAAWSPLALLLTVEMITRVPTHHRLLGPLRLAATLAVAGIAAWVSYWHMAAVAARYGETGASRYLLPFSVDGLVLVATISLLEISSRVTAANCAPPPGPVTTTSEIPDKTTDDPEQLPSSAPITTGQRQTGARLSGNAASTTPGPGSVGESSVSPVPVRDVHAAAVDGDDRTRGTRQDRVGESDASRPATLPGDPDELPADTAAAVQFWRQREPRHSPAQIAHLIGRSERTVRRHWTNTPNTVITAGRPDQR